MGSSEFQRGGRQWRVVPLFLIGAVSLCLLAWPARAVELVSVSIHGSSGNNASSGVAVNADGNFVTFYSDATNLVSGDTNALRDVFVRNRISQTTELISVNSAGEQANGPSHAAGDAPAINGDGQIVAFYSDATNLAPNDLNRQPDVFVRLRATGTTEIVSDGAGGVQGNGASIYPSIDRVGNLVAFQSEATNLVPDDTNGVADIFVRDRTSGTTERLCSGSTTATVPQANGDSLTPAISADGNVVAFASLATNLVPNDVNRHLDVFVCDRHTGVVEIVSVSSSGVQGDGDSILPAISEDGRFVAFKSTADNLVPNDNNGFVDVFVRDRVAGTTERVSVNVRGGDANEASFPPSISYDGRFVAFGSAATNLVANDFNDLSSVFVRDRQNGVTLLVDVNDFSQQANGGTPDIPPGVSGDGKQIGYVSFATNLVDNDLNETADVFIGRNPFICDAETPCPPGFVCVDGFCVPGGGTPTPTPTGPTATRTPPPGPADCCQCAGPACQAPSMSACPAGCSIVRRAACLDTGNCAAFTPTPTTTSTPLISPTPTKTSTPCPTGTPCPADFFKRCDPGCDCACLDCNACPAGQVRACAQFECGCACVTPTPTNTPTITASQTPKSSPTNTATITPTRVTTTATATPTSTPSRSPTRTPSSPTPGPGLDQDACNCRITPPSERTYRAPLLGLGLPLVLIVWRRRFRR